MKFDSLKFPIVTQNIASVNFLSLKAVDNVVCSVKFMSNGKNERVFRFPKTFLVRLASLFEIYFALSLRKLHKSGTKQYKLKLFVWYGANKPKTTQCGVTIVHGTCNKRLHSVITQQRQQRLLQSDRPLTRSFACASELCK